MKALVLLAVVVTGAPALAASAGDAQALALSRAERVCAVFQQRRSGARRICLTTSAWQDRLGPDWRQILTGRNAEDDLDALGPRTRSNPRLPRIGL
jgi:hypothetical protein